MNYDCEICTALLKDYDEKPLIKHMEQINHSPNECDSCGYKNIKLNINIDKYAHDDKKICFMCDICYCTHAGNGYKWPEQYSDSHLLQTVAYIGNMILEEIRK